MGYVFRAEDDNQDRVIALKVMKPEVAANQESRKRFVREGWHSQSIQSEHVVTIYHVGYAGDTAYMAMEYLEGQNLDDWFKDNTVA